MTALKCPDAQELVTALVDDELTAAERALIQEHLRDCPDCRLGYERERSLKSEIRKAGAAIRAPARLREAILSDRRLFPRRPAFETGASRPGYFFRPAYALALAVVLLIPVLYMLRPAPQPVVLAAIEAHEKILSGELPTFRGASPEEIEARLFQSVAGAFPPMTYDLSTIHQSAVAGSALDFNGRKVLVTVYEGSGPPITCYTFPGTENDAPAEAARFYDPDKKISFYSYSLNGLNAVFHREGPLICVLVSRLPGAELLTIARSSA